LAEWEIYPGKRGVSRVKGCINSGGVSHRRRGVWKVEGCINGRRVSQVGRNIENGGLEHGERV
jgi:hypothetical protein